MKYYHVLIVLMFINCSKSEIKSLESKQIIAKSIQKHDPKKQWETTSFKVHIQEPRNKNPHRYSIVDLNNKTGHFELQRNREAFISKHIIDENGNAKTFLDHKIVVDTLMIQKYRLNPKINVRYKRFYQLLLGLPMSLQSEKVIIKDKIEPTLYNKKEVYKINIELKEPLFSKYWNLYFSQEDYMLLGVEMMFPDNPKKGERLFFDGIIKIDEILVPRMRHWYNMEDVYTGSDIILTEIK
ncbi:hypothetical protein JL193_08290 [Polaribacter batillariae]|uniref:Uncharacterized protein n=1 Tax=Polaribacter batillariae TaxID=2808900 RepID=A0ABX7SY96_9FLAO|nr:DUF6503 family protein [Polaribacter batillariae]QTD39220.1 hypothetical protein JL193_08290 [Polaribacter batillariae]